MDEDVKEMEPSEEDPRIKFFQPEIDFVLEMVESYEQDPYAIY